MFQRQGKTLSQKNFYKKVDGGSNIVVLDSNENLPNDWKEHCNGNPKETDAEDIIQTDDSPSDKKENPEETVSMVDIGV